ncbi:MAG TPA: CpsD/CapB family tyrosine-protein kinase [Chloroflexota bacterium]|nr:CpsD/CapB family tyrosine-protein kinase [Chloroflexota bacterium]
MAIAEHMEEAEEYSSPLSLPDEAYEVYRHLYGKLQLHPGSRAVVGITSAIRGEGRTTVALGLAATIAQDSAEPVLVVEADIENPQLHELLGGPRRGLVDAVTDGEPLAGVMTPITPNLLVVPAGSHPENVGAFFYRLATSRLPQGDGWWPAVVIVDLPPIMNYGYGPMIAGIADVLLMVTRANVTPTTLVREAVARLEGNRPRGLVLNDHRTYLPSWISRAG